MLDLAVLAIFPGIMVFVAISDLLTMTIPNRVSIILVAGFFALAFAMGLPLSTIGWHAAAGALVLAICFTLFNFGWIGGGDAKFAATSALWLGFGVLGAYGVLTAIFGGILTLGILQLRRIHLSEERWAGTWLGRLHDKTVGVPYGVALAAAGLVVYPDTAIWLAARAV
jgi:prepilin peptidase CpaA